MNHLLSSVETEVAGRIQFERLRHLAYDGGLNSKIGIVNNLESAQFTTRSASPSQYCQVSASSTPRRRSAVTSSSASLQQIRMKSPPCQPARMTILLCPAICIAHCPGAKGADGAQFAALSPGLDWCRDLRACSIVFRRCLRDRFPARPLWGLAMPSIPSTAACREIAE